MESIKQYLYDTLVDEFNSKPCFLLARILYLFCHFNPSFEMPGNIQNAFVKGLMDDEVRAFSLRYPPTTEGDGAQLLSGDEAEVSLAEMKKDIHRQIAAENLSRGTGKTYTPSMVEKAAAKYKGVLSYNEILEIVILSAHKKL